MVGIYYTHMSVCTHGINVNDISFSFGVRKILFAAHVTFLTLENSLNPIL